MENIFEAGHVPYEPAPPLPHVTPLQWIIIGIEAIFDVITVFFLSAHHFFLSVKEWIIPTPKKDVSGQLALVTGGGNGIGRAVALELAKHGCRIAIADIEEAAAIQTAKDIKDLHRVDVKAYQVDVADTKALQKLKTEIEEDLGPVDILVNNAGLMPLHSLRESSEEAIRRLIDVNVLGNYWCIRTFITGMLQRRRGHIIGIVSLSSLHPMGGAVVYSSTKSAAHGLYDAFREELRQEGYGDCIYITRSHPYFVSTRKDLMEAINLRFPAISAEDSARVTVDAALRNYRSVVVPRIYKPLATLLRSLPDRVTDLARDVVLREKQTRMFKSPEATKAGINTIQSEADLMQLY